MEVGNQISSPISSLYSDSVEVVHADENNYSKVKIRSSQNFVMSSTMRSFDAPIKPVGLGIKYVASGQESYWVNNKHMPIIGGQYLLINDSIPTVDAVIKNELTSSICVDIDPKLFNDVLYQVIKPDELSTYENAQKYLLSPDLLIRQAKASYQFQKLLNRFLNSKELLNNHSRAIELIYELTGMLIKENLDLINSCYRLKTAKASTRKELFSRLLLGREILADNIYSTTTIAEVAQACSISEFRFFRLFRQCFGVSPYDYYLTLKIRKSVELRKKGWTWGEISSTLNFNDLSAFNKAFKKIHHFAPTIIEKNF